MTLRYTYECDHEDCTSYRTVISANSSVAHRILELKGWQNWSGTADITLCPSHVIKLKPEVKESISRYHMRWRSDLVEGEDY